MKSSNKGFDVRGLMLDPARLTERHKFYFDLLPQLAQWGYNTLWWHFSDDEGFALKLKSHPELASPFALSRAETRRLIREAGQLGIDVVPEVESLGHALFITRLPQYAHLFNGNPQGHNAICPSHPDTLPLLKEIIKEVAELFPSPYLHAGLDEAQIGDCPRCARRSRKKPDWWVFAEHVKAIHKIVTDCGKEMIMWADSVEKHPELLKILPRDIILAHWHYRDVSAEKIRPSIKAGFRILCVPAISGTILQPGLVNIRNVSDMTDLAGKLPARKCGGVVTCWWEPFRQLRDTFQFAMAYAGKASRLRRGQSPQRVVPEFLADYFGLKDAAVAEAFWQEHVLSSDFERSDMHALYPDSLSDLPEALRIASAGGFQERHAMADNIVKILKHGRKMVLRHRAEYDAILLAARIQATALNNGMKLREACDLYRRAAAWTDGKAPQKETLAILKKAADTLESMTKPIEDLARATDREWDRTRYRQDEKKDNSSPLMRARAARAILPILVQSDRFQRQLTKEFRRRIAAWQRGGPFPGGL